MCISRKINSFLITIIILSSCSPVYIPNSINIPTLSKKGDISADLATNMFVTGINIKTAYALTDRYAFMLNGFFCRS